MKGQRIAADQKDNAARRLLKWVLDIPHLFSKFVVLWCVFYGTYYSDRALTITEQTGADTSPTLGAILLFFGGELVLLFGKDAVKGKTSKNKKENDV